MKYNTFMPSLFSGELWDYTSAQDPASGQMQHTYFFSKNIRFNLISAEKGTMYLYADEQLRPNVEIRNLRDPNGNQVFKAQLTGQPMTTYVGVSEPVFDAFGILIGYRHDLSQGI